MSTTYMEENWVAHEGIDADNITIMDQKLLKPEEARCDHRLNPITQHLNLYESLSL